MFSDEARCVYQKNQIAEVICQLRFPEILTIEANAPAAFQESVRKAFPKYTVNKEVSAPIVTCVPGNMRLETPPAINNYQFYSVDGAWRINLTSKFISLSSSNYTRWEDFANRLDLMLTAFITVYQPALFERIGLRYINAISRRDLNLAGIPYRDLMQSMYLGPLEDDSIPESAFHSCGIDFQLNAGNTIQAKVHAGPGILNRNGQTDQESKFIFDQDLFASGDIPVNHAASTLDTIHTKAYRLFRGAITETLHAAMHPMIV